VTRSTAISRNSLPACRPAGSPNPADVAPAYIYLMESDFTTGETVHIDGGHRLI
jgi:hypothetical protein